MRVFIILTVFYRFLYLSLTLSKLIYVFAPSNFPSCVGPNRAIPSGHDGPILPAQVANQKTGFSSKYPRALAAIQ